jgi:hypothetical protein
VSLDVCECVRYMNQVSGETGGGSISQRQGWEGMGKSIPISEACRSTSPYAGPVDDATPFLRVLTV